jgi:hypothetical protein
MLALGTLRLARTLPCSRVSSQLTASATSSTSRDGNADCLATGPPLASVPLAFVETATRTTPPVASPVTLHQQDEVESVQEKEELGEDSDLPCRSLIDHPSQVDLLAPEHCGWTFHRKLRLRCNRSLVCRLVRFEHQQVCHHRSRLRRSLYCRSFGMFPERMSKSSRLAEEPSCSKSGG